MTIRASRYHDISVGHRVHKHESKCRHLHGHNYRIHFHCEADQLDEVGRVIDFSVIKEKLCMWTEKHWDHRMLIWMDDPLAQKLLDIDSMVVLVPFNPTAENIAMYLVNEVGPRQLQGTGVRLAEVTIEETAKCHATFSV